MPPKQYRRNARQAGTPEWIPGAAGGVTAATGSRAGRLREAGTFARKTVAARSDRDKLRAMRSCRGKHAPSQAPARLAGIRSGLAGHEALKETGAYRPKAAKRIFPLPSFGWPP